MPRTGAGGSGNSKPMRNVPFRAGAAARKVHVDKVVENPRNLREDDLWESEQERMEMVTSMQETGLIQALVVCTRDAFLAEYEDDSDRLGNAEYVVIAGHRRLAAARLAGLDELRIDVRDEMVPSTDLVMLEENLKRKALNAFQEGEGYRRLAAKGESHAKIASKVGKGKSTITKRIALLGLPQDAKEAVLAKKLSVDSAYNLLVALDGSNLDRLLEAAAIMKRDGVGASDAVNSVLAAGSGRTGSTTATSLTTAHGSAGTATQVSGDAGGSVLTEPELEAATGSTQASVPPARTEPVLSEPAEGSAEGDSETEQESTSSTEKQQQARVVSPAVTAETAGRAQANAARNEHCGNLVLKHDAPATDPQSIRIATAALTHASPAALERAHNWMKKAGVTDADALEANSYRDAVLVRGDATLISRLAYAVALADDELRASNRSRNWDYRDIAHLRHLMDAGYEPSDWERRHLG